MAGISASEVNNLRRKLGIDKLEKRVAELEAKKEEKPKPKTSPPYTIPKVD